MTRASRHIGLAVCLLAAVAATGGCVRYDALVIPPRGALYSNFRAPLIIPKTGHDIRDLTRLERHTKYVNVPVPQQGLVLGATTFAWDKIDLAAVAREGGITTIEYADYRLKSICGVYAEMEVTVYGR